ncbi:competence type IV pilus minor pilin ComGF [Terribacillus saccharophilus]|uniref:competence type IV pilus minor pilin ComGF n=1 Tax=Terribacillus saccharophilus TaxID=361277 RepID=UPI0039824B08
MHFSNEKGFTLLEALITLSILILILATIPPLFAPLTKSMDTEASSVRQALHFITMEVHKGTSVRVEDDRLLIQNQQGRTAVFEQYKDMIRRRVNEKGHEIYLHHINDLTISSDEFTIVVTVKGKRGATYEKRIALQ